jgi:hypothetical protein
MNWRWKLIKKRLKINTVSSLMEMRYYLFNPYFKNRIK